MKKTEIEHRLAEALDMSSIVNKTIETTIEELKKTETSKDDVLKVLSDISGFTKDALATLQSIEVENRTKFLEECVTKIVSWSQAESERVRFRVHLLQERASALQSVHSFVSERAKSYEARAKAIERVADPNRDKRHPEKLSVLRAAKEIEETRTFEENEEDE